MVWGMMRVEITGMKKVMEACAWLKQQQWDYNINFYAASPFSGKYCFEIPDPKHAFMFKLRWA